jgi:hypothetical protein
MEKIEADKENHDFNLKSYSKKQSRSCQETFLLSGSILQSCNIAQL